MKNTTHKKIGAECRENEKIFIKVLNEGNCDDLNKYLSIIFTYKISDDPYNVVTSYLSDNTYPGEYLLKALLQDHYSEIFTKCGNLGGIIAINTIRSLIRKNSNYLENYSYHSIIDLKNSFNQDEFISILILFVCNHSELSKFDELQSLLNYLVREVNVIFKKIFLHLIAERFNDFKDMFWSLAQNPFMEKHLKPELYQIIEFNKKNFSEENINQLINWIEEINVSGVNYDDQERDSYLASVKGMWLHSLISTENDKISELFSHYSKISTPLDPPELELSECNVSFQDLLFDDSQICMLQSIPNGEINQFLLSQKKKLDIFSGNKLLYESNLITAVKRNPEKFLKEIEYLEDLDHLYIFSIVDGIYEALIEGRITKYNKIIQVFEFLINQEGFWNDYSSSADCYFHDICKLIIRIIDTGFSKNLIFEDQFLKIKDILLQIDSHIVSNLDSVDNIHRTIINTEKGSSLLAIFHLIQYCSSFTEENDWDIEIWDYIKSQIVQRPSIELSYILGFHFSLLYNFDKNWIQSNIVEVFSTKNDLYWEAIIGGIAHKSSLRKEIYQFLKETSQYKKAIEYNFTNSKDMEKIIQHICIGYMEKLELLEDNHSLILSLLKNTNTQQYCALISFVWRNREEYIEKRDLVKDLWSMIMYNLETNNSKLNIDEINCLLFKWFEVFADLDEQIFTWLKIYLRTPCAYIQFHFIDLFSPHVSKYPNEIGELFLIFIKNQRFLQHQEEKMLKLIHMIFENEGFGIGCNICQYLSHIGFKSHINIYRKYCF